MKHINIAIENMNNSVAIKDEDNLSIIERIVKKTGNPKIAAVLALDLFLVGVDTVRQYRIIKCGNKQNLIIEYHFCRHRLRPHRPFIN